MNHLSSFEQLKVLGHPLRLAILRRLMSQPATLSQLGLHFRQSPAHIRHHLKVLELARLVALTTAPPLQNHLEKYYQAVAPAWLVNLAVLPEAPAGSTTIVIGSQDLATRKLAEYFQGRPAGLALQIIPLNSLDGLIQLQQGVCQMTTCHLREPGSGEYNRTYIQHLFPGQAMALIHLFAREAGLLVQPGNPKRIRGLADLARADIRLINRERGAGMRVWLDQSLAQLGLEPEAVTGYDAIALSHQQVAQAIQAGNADVGLGIAACAREAGLDFIPLLQEPYDLVSPPGSLLDRRYRPLFEHLNSAAFRVAIQAQAGYLVPSNAGQVDTIHPIS